MNLLRPVVFATLKKFSLCKNSCVRRLPLCLRQNRVSIFRPSSYHRYSPSASEFAALHVPYARHADARAMSSGESSTLPT